MRHKRLACFVKRGQHILDANALMDGPWFVGTNIYMCKPGRRIFICILPKCQPLRAINLPIEYYHPDFLKHVGHKLGKLLKVDAITSAAIRGWYARLCVQISTANPLPKHVKIGAFWQDIVYENLPLLCYWCRWIGHRETHCSEVSPDLHTKPHHVLVTRSDQGAQDHDQEHTPWKTVQTRRARVRGSHTESFQHGKLP